MTKLVKKGVELPVSQQRGFGSRRPGKIAYQGNVRAIICSVQAFLLPESRHPGTSTFPFAREKIEEKDCQEVIVIIIHLIGSNFGMINRNNITGDETKAPQPPCQLKDS